MRTANKLYPDKEMLQIEDALITGVLRQNIGVNLVPFDKSLSSWMWSNVFSYCPWMTMTKLTFFNNLGKDFCQLSE